MYKACARAYRRSEILKRLNLCHHRAHKVWRPCWTTAQRGPRNHQCLTCMRFTNQMGRCPRNHTSQLGGEKMIIVVLIRWTDSHEQQRRETGQFLKPFSFFQVGQPFWLVWRHAPQIIIKATLFEDMHPPLLRHWLLKPPQGRNVGKEYVETTVYPTRHGDHNSSCDELEGQKPKSNNFCLQTTAVSKFKCYSHLLFLVCKRLWVL